MAVLILLVEVFLIFEAKFMAYIFVGEVFYSFSCHQFVNKDTY